jgi:alkylation response protein AidB-like acyl-CoA dehydrogenase
MATALGSAETTEDAVSEVRAWLGQNWDPEISLGDWWGRLGESGWSAPTLPVDSYGRGLSRSDAVRVHQELTAAGAVGPPNGLGLLLAAPTIVTHGTREQIGAYVRDIVTGQKAWCQLFSEPGAGSDLAGLTTRAERDGDEWVVTGQKVWTSGGQYADLGMLLARTDFDVPKHQGITWFALDMRQPGVEIRPLRELTGHAVFNEVFLTEARVSSTAVIGGVNQGWAVANTTLANERAGLGAGGGGSGAGSAALPGQIAGHLHRRAGDFAARPKPVERRGDRRPQSAAQLLIDIARGQGRTTDPLIRQGLARLHTLGELGRYNNERLKAVRATGGDIPGMANISKLAMSDIVRLQRDLGLQILGPSGMLHAYDDDQRAALDKATGNPFLSLVTTTALYAQAPPIYGGTDQIQRNIIGERALGLPKEPRTDAAVAFSSLPRNA